VNEDMMVTENDLVASAQNGDRNAFGELVVRHYPCVIRVLSRLCNQVPMAEDAAQEAFLRAWTRLPQYHPRAPFRNWVMRIAVHAALDMLRRKPTVYLEEEMAAGNLDAPDDPESLLLEKEKATVVRKAVGSLPESCRTALVLREYGGFSYQEISTVLEIPLGTVMSRLNHAREQLRMKLISEPVLLELEYA
jgi:RNA polymerase sigma factor (sigma-70 family)